jgi:hypothetical protein
VEWRSGEMLGCSSLARGGCTAGVTSDDTDRVETLDG